MRNLIFGLLAASFMIVSAGTAHGATAPDTGSCTYAITRESETLIYKGGAITLGVTATGSTSCPAPVISNNLSWVSLTSTFGTTRGTVKLAIPEYGSSILRTGTVTIGGNTFTITQDGEPCSLALSAPSSSFPNEGGTGQFTVTATPADCAWTATGSATSPWISITSGGSGPGAGSVDYTVAAYTGKKARNGKITVESTLNKKSKTYAVKQGTKPILQGNPAFRAAAVAGCQTLGAGVSYPYTALQLASPTGSPIRNFAATSPHSLLWGARALKASASQGAGTLTFLSALNLYTDSGTLKGDVITVRLYSDAAGKQSAGSLVITLPGITDPADPTNYSIYPAVIKLSVNLTGGNLPCVGSGQITFTGGTGANSMTGTFTLTKDDVVFNLDLALDDQFNVSGSITVVESGATLLLTDVQGALLDTLTCNVTVDPYGWTGHGTINLLTGAMTSSINMETGAPAATAASDSTYKLNIIYPDTTGDVVADAIVAVLTDFDAITATGGTPQSAQIDTAFASPLIATVKDSDGNPVSGATVTFVVPDKDASGSFADGVTTAVTDASGVVTSAVFTANGIAGSYKITATAPGVNTSAVFALTNLAAGPAGDAFAYAGNSCEGYISQYKIDLNGALTPMNPAYVGTPQWDVLSIAADPSGKYVYAISVPAGPYLSGVPISQYTIGTNGALVPMSQTPVSTGANPTWIAVHPSGKYVYVTNYYDGSITIYTINPDGSLAYGPASASMPYSQVPGYITVHPSGKYAYVAIGGAGDIVSQYTVNLDGSLTPMSTASVAAGTGPTGITVHPSGQYVYVTNSGGTVSQYTVSQVDGSLAPMTPATVAAGGSPNSIAVDLSGKYAYVANMTDYTVSQYTISQVDGSLTPMHPATVAVKTYALSIAVAPSGKCAYVADENTGAISQFTIGSNGSLAPMNPATVAATCGPIVIITVPGHK